MQLFVKKHQKTSDIKGTASIKMHEIDPSHVKETCFTYSVPTYLNTKKLLVVLECVKDHAFDSTDCLRSCVIMPLTRSVVEFAR